MSDIPTNGNHERLLAAFKSVETFCRVMLDAYVVIDPTGKILKSNQLMNQLVGLTSRQILKATSLDEMLGMRLGDQVVQVADILKYQTPTRLDEVRGKNNVRDDLNLIIGVYPFVDQGELLGSFILIRDVTAETNLQDKYKTEATKSITDKLTGLYNRGYLEEYLTSTVNYLMRMPEGAPAQALTLLILDVDHFKKVNDVHGHQAGDHVLRMMGDVMRQYFRKTDVLCRYGGEEFLAILPNTDLAGALVAGEKFRTAMEALDIQFEGKRIPITVSGGLAQISIGSETYAETIARADAALYSSKEGGRNRISIHDGRAIRKG
jgi:diguanylate cyclase (GGDEF)-like protein